MTQTAAASPIPAVQWRQRRSSAKLACCRRLCATTVAVLVFPAAHFGGNFANRATTG